MAAILKEEPPDLSVTNQNVPPGLERIVRHCLEKNPERRFQSASDIAFNLESLSGTSAVLAPPGAVSRALRAGAALPIAIALGVAAAAFFTGRRMATRPLPYFTQLTFQRGTIVTARFAPDGRTVLYSAAWDGRPIETFSTGLDLPGPRSLGVGSSKVHTVSADGDVLLLLEPVRDSGGMFTGTLARAPLAGGAPKPEAANVRDFDCLPDGKTCALVRVADGRFRLEYPAGKLLYETAGYIADPRISRDGKRVGFLDHPVRGDDRGFVAVSDSNGQTRRLGSPWGGSEYGLAWSPDSREIWFSAAYAGPAMSLYAVDLSGRTRLVYRMAGGIRLYDIAADGRVLLSRDDRRISVIARSPSDSAERDLTWRNASELADISADGRQALVLDWSETAGPLYESCLQATDGSTLLRLGKGAPASLSPDGKSAISVLRSYPPELQILPVGPGEPRKLPRGAIEEYHQFADWMPDGKSIVFTASEKGHSPRIYMQSLDGGAPRPVSPEGVYTSNSDHPTSPDGKLMVLFDKEGVGYAYPLDGGEPRAIPHLTYADAGLILRWASDGRSFFVKAPRVLPPRIWRVDAQTGVRTLHKEILGYDPAGITSLGGEFQITPDGGAYAYDQQRILDDLYVVEGLR
jgi:Tol biopolymer transport system component